jgi:hypothetical protein
LIDPQIKNGVFKCNASFLRKFHTVIFFRKPMLFELDYSRTIISRLFNWLTLSRSFTLAFNRLSNNFGYGLRLFTLHLNERPFLELARVFFTPVKFGCFAVTFQAGVEPVILNLKVVTSFLFCVQQ